MRFEYVAKDACREGACLCVRNKSQPGRITLFPSFVGELSASDPMVMNSAPEFFIASTILSSVLMSPACSAAVVANVVNVWSEVSLLTDAGILVFLTADDAVGAEAGVRWLRDPQGLDAQAAALLRLVTPGAYYWPKGEVRMPLNAALDDAGLAAVRTIAAGDGPHG